MFKGDDSGGSNREQEMPLVIAKARSADIPDLVRLNGVVQNLHAQLSPDIFRSDWAPSDLEAFWADRLDDQNSEVIIASLDNRAVGYIWFEVQTREQDALHLRRRRIYVHHIAVDESARGEGVGANLLDQAELEAERAGISNVVLDAWAANETAQGFFGARGYGPVNVGLGKSLAGR
ncbi:N-acetyltransferase family protein [Sphingomonas oryzagri]